MLPLFLTLALDSAMPMPPAGTYRYQAFINNKSVGGSTVTVSPDAPGTKIVESSASHLPTGDTRTNSTLLLDASLVPAIYTASYKVQDDSMLASVSFNGRSATVTAGTDQRTFQMGGSSKNFVIIDSGTMSGFLMLPAQMKAWNDADATALIPGVGSEAFLSVLRDVPQQRPGTIPAADVSLSLAGEAPFVEWYDPNTLVVDEVEIPGQNLRITRRR